jgi:hypothetical protein
MQNVNGTLMVAVADEVGFGADQDQTISTAYSHLVNEMPINEDKGCGRTIPAAVNKMRLPDLQ